MAADIPFEENLNGVKIQYLTDWNFSLSKSVTMDGKRVSTEKVLRGYAPRVAALAQKAGYKRAQIGSIGDFYAEGIRKGKFLTLDTMFVARFLKR
jgi:hypothetical protein